MSLSTELTAFLAPLVTGFASPSRAALLLRELGLVERRSVVGQVPEEITALARAAGDAVAAIGALDDPGVGPAERAAGAVAAVRAVLDALRALEVIGEGSLDDLDAPFDSPETWTVLATALPAYLLARWLRTEHPVADGLLRLSGAVRYRAPGGVEVDWEALARLATDPGGGLAALVAGNPAAVWEPLAGIVAALGAARPDQPLRFQDGAVALASPPRPPPPPPGFGLAVGSPASGENWSLQVDLQPLPGGAPGVQLLGWLDGATGVDSPLREPWTLSVSTGATGPAGFILTPSGVLPAAGTAADSLSLSLSAAPDVPWALVGSPGATRLELAGLALEVGADGLLGSPGVSAALRTDGLRLVVSAGDGDSFLRYLLAGGEVSADAPLSLTWSSTEGFAFGGQAGFQVTVLVDRSFGPVRFQTLRIVLAAGPQGATLELAALVSLELGPLYLLIDGIGLTAALVPAAEPGGGAFGDVDFLVLFRPPDGIGLAIDAGPVSGGGVLYIDHEAGEYAGILDLDVLAVGITAVGLLDTRLPGDAWSLFLALFIEVPSIPLGFGFTLNGVGGVAGINRTLDEGGLRAAIRSGSLNHVLFPDDPVADAPRVIEAMGAIFPSAVGRYVFGPMVQIGWGTPTLIEAQVGIVISLPDPIVIAVLGSVTVALPTEDVDLVALHLEVAGVIDLGAATLSVYASLTGSHVVGFPLSGDMALESAFGDQPSFLMSLGGSHPGFVRPAGFPQMSRLALGINAGPFLEVRFECYFALSSNSLQFGAAFELSAEVEGFGIAGGAEFDALIEFSPFSLRAELGYHVSVKAAGVDLLAVWLDVTLSGPNPWHVVGTATFTILGIDNTIRLDQRIGSKEPEPGPVEEDVLSRLRTALSLVDAWSVGSGGGRGVVLAAGDEPEGTLALAPDGTLGVSQRLVPLDVAIDRSDVGIVGGWDRFDVEPDGPGLSSSGPLTDWFAVSSYVDLGPRERLSAPSFERLKSGVAFGGGGPTAGGARRGTLAYEEILRDPELDDEGVPSRFHAGTDPRAEALAASPAARLPLGFHVAAADTPLRVVEPGFAATDRRSGAVLARTARWTKTRSTPEGRKARATIVPAWEIHD